MAVILQFVALATSGIAIWTKLNNEMTILKSRIIALEKSENQVNEMLNQLVEGVNEIKLLLAKKGIE